MVTTNDRFPGGSPSMDFNRVDVTRHRERLTKSLTAKSLGLHSQVHAMVQVCRCAAGVEVGLF